MERNSCVAIYISIFGFDQVCWFGYFDKKVYWIIKGPFMMALLFNVLFLVNVMTILCRKLKKSYSDDSVEQIKRSLKAAMLLCPLLGITHLLELFPIQLENRLFNIVYAVVNCFLLFYSGVYLSCLYCFMNSQVRENIGRYWTRTVLRKSVFPKKYTTTSYHVQINLSDTAK